MKVRRRKVAVFTGNRADYGLLYPVIRAIAANPLLKYFLIVSGGHLKNDLGRTLQEIAKDGFQIYSQVEIDMAEDTLYGTAQAIGNGIVGISRSLADLTPDILVVYGDRFESFAAMVAGTQMGIATAHIEGGDYTEGGALDDSVRHAMTKLAHLHFTTNEQATRRVQLMGEEHWRIFTVGLPALDLIRERVFASPGEVFERFHLDPRRPILVFTQHSVATEFGSAADQIRPSLQALEEAGQEWGCQVIITYPNDDAGGHRIMREVEDFEKKTLSFVQVHHSLGRHYYHGVLNVAAGCIGNSSSGIKETPAFHCPCVNIGDRQQGRLRSNNVIDVGYDKDEIKEAIGRCLHDDKFLESVRICSNPYGSGDAGRKIAEILESVQISQVLIQKKMTY